MENVNSDRFNKLQNRIKNIEKNLYVESKIDFNYTEEEIDRLRGYILLVHAEIEAFLEDRAIETLNRAIEDWKKNNKYNIVLVSLIFHMQKKIENIEKKNIKNLESGIYYFLKQYKKNVIEKNHGIKKDNILSILSPIGLTENDIDETWLNTMESFGLLRGEIAHSSSYKTTQILDPKAQKNEIEVIIEEIKKIDLVINSLILS